jgi:hypothetical protein
MVMAAQPFNPIRVGIDKDKNLDRVQQRVQTSVASLVQAQGSTAAALAVHGDLTVHSTADSHNVAANVTLMTSVPSAGVTLGLPSATGIKNVLRIKHVSDASGTPTVTIKAPVVNGRQQLIDGAASTTVALGVTLNLVSDGTDFHSV